MSHSNNPFVRGYDGLSVQRLLAISYDDDCPLSYLPLHVSQSHLSDSQVERHACVFVNLEQLGDGGAVGVERAIA